jgi:transcriptional regulator with XRE-family HTH domain
MKKKHKHSRNELPQKNTAVDEMRNILKIEMQRQRITTTELGRRAGMAQGNLSKYLCGHKDITTGTWGRLLSALHPKSETLDFQIDASAWRGDPLATRDRMVMEDIVKHYDTVEI